MKTSLKKRMGMRDKLFECLISGFIILAVMSGVLSAQTVTERADELLSTWNQKADPGMAVMLIRDGKIAYRKTFGIANLGDHSPIKPDTQFLISSITKQFTAMAIMILVEDGKLRLDDTLAKWCPEFPAYAQNIRSGTC